MVVLLLSLGCRSQPPVSPEVPSVELVALAASSLTEVMSAIGSAWAEAGGTASVTFSFDSSAKLARQVEAGAPADLLFTADTVTMDGVERKGLLVAGTRRSLAGNTLVVVVPAAATWTPTAPADLPSDAVRHLALAGENVPAGTYAREALAAAGVWTALEGRVVSGDNVRTTLAWVARGEADAGVVYATDARAEPAVRVAFAFAEDAHPPIVLPGAVLTSSRHPDAASAFLTFAASPEGMDLFAAAGFRPPPAP